MTPTFIQLFKKINLTGNKHFVTTDGIFSSERTKPLERLARSKIFSFWQIDNLLNETLKSMLDAISDSDVDNQVGFNIDIGKNIILPDNYCFFELKQRDYNHSNDNSFTECDEFDKTKIFRMENLDNIAFDSLPILIEKSFGGMYNLSYFGNLDNSNSVELTRLGYFIITENAPIEFYIDLELAINEFKFINPDSVEGCKKRNRNLAILYALKVIAAISVLSSSHSAYVKKKGSWISGKQLKSSGLFKNREMVFNTVFINVHSNYHHLSSPIDTIEMSHSPRALHWCRAHHRHRDGKIQSVRAHWRGDPAFGIRISNYQLKGESTHEYVDLAVPITV